MNPPRLVPVYRKVAMPKQHFLQTVISRGFSAPHEAEKLSRDESPAMERAVETPGGKDEEQVGKEEEEEEGEEDTDLGEFRNEQTGEIGGPKGLEPTRFGDWEKGGRCTDF
eukprot:TRINITY_DN2303_c0_g1_i1.p1 TRINITY_DN2303_c0_g1~~TRINITY_DN2303_c0_g1_i1.p1  ORF type:complete len:111 (-),score=26.88 TRINITY_DN2303_c0_g1_i1:733-1065(-)